MSGVAPPRVAGPGPENGTLRAPARRWVGLRLLLRRWLAHWPYPALTRVLPARTPDTDGFSRAIEHLQRGETQAAFEAMAQAAERGDPRAARIALLMLDRGPRLFSRSFSASPAQRARWAEDPARAPRR